MTHQERKLARRRDILQAALGIAAQDGLMRMRRAAIARQAGCANGSVNSAFGSMAALRREVVRAAVRGHSYPVIMEALTVRELAGLVPDDARREALVSFV